MTVQQLSPFSKSLSPEQLPCFLPLSQRLHWFDDQSISFLNRLSGAILKTELRRLPAMVALAYWLRKSNIETLRRPAMQAAGSHTTLHRQPLGTVFHVCPGNVDTIFVYSLAISLLAGNRNVLRLSNRVESEALHSLFGLMNEAMQQPEFSIFQPYISVVSYGHEEELNRLFSSRADARILWGGNQTVQHFRSLPTAPRCRDIAFPDRLSISILQAEKLLELKETAFTEMARLLYNDAYVFDQLGCSSPQVLLFWGETETAAAAETRLYTALLQHAMASYTSDADALASLKFNKLTDDALAATIQSSRRQNNLVVFAALSQPAADLHTCGGGYFYTAVLSQAADIAFYCSKRLQTATYFGLNDAEKLQLLQATAGTGLDRLVPVGQALAFSNYWDGYDLLEQLTQLTAVV